MRTRLAVAIIAVSLSVAGCRTDPPADPHEVVARTTGQELTVEQMGKLMGDAKLPMAVTPENGVIVANLWLTYQRLAFAAAHSDTLESQVTVGITPAFNNERVTTLLQNLRRSMPSDTATQAAYDSALYGLYAARHILVTFPPKATSRQQDSVRRAALLLWRSLTPANFAQMAQKNSADKKTAESGGLLGVFPKQQMNPAVAPAVEALLPDSLTKILPTQLGLEIIQRLSWPDAKVEYVPAFSRAVMQARDSAAGNKMALAVNLQVTKAGPGAARTATSDPVKGGKDTTTIATFDKGGRFTAAEMVAWVNLMQPTLRAQVFKNLPQESDAVVTSFIHNIAIRGVLLRAADSARISVPDSTKAKYRDLFLKEVVRNWKALGVAPDQLADSAKTPADREQLAARRVQRFIERGMAADAQLTPVSAPIETALNAKYETVINSDALARAVEMGAGIRSADSAKAAASAPKPPGQSTGAAAKPPTGR